MGRYRIRIRKPSEAKETVPPAHCLGLGPVGPDTEIGHSQSLKKSKSKLFASDHNLICASSPTETCSATSRMSSGMRPSAAGSTVKPYWP